MKRNKGWSWLVGLVWGLVFVPALAVADQTADEISPATTYAPAQPGQTNVSTDEAWEGAGQLGQLLLIGFRGLSVTPEHHLIRDIQDYNLGGVILYRLDLERGDGMRNIQSPEQVKKLTNDLQALSTVPLLISIDQEGGQVTRLDQSVGFSQVASASSVGERNDPDFTAAWSRGIARQLQQSGLNLNFAPVVDLAVNPDCAVIFGKGRSFGPTPERVIRHARVFVQEHRRAGVLTALKHFPGHGSSDEDSHLGMVDVTDSWQERELKPYRSLVSEGKADLIMTAHVFLRQFDPCYPATLSHAIVNGILREQLGFDGVVVSDDLQMKAIEQHYTLRESLKQTLNAGVDMLLFSNNPPSHDPDLVPRVVAMLKDLVDSGEVSRERIDQALDRIQTLKMRLDSPQQ